MPSQYNLPAAFGNAVVEDINRFQQLPFYLVKSEVKQFPRWDIYNKLFGTIDWQENMGAIMRAVTPQASPVADTFAFPNPITSVPNKNVFSVTESTEEASLKMHRFESQQFSFVPSFQAFWRDHVSYAHKDLVRQIAVFNNQFIRTGLWGRSRYVYFAGTGVESSPSGELEYTLTAAGTKTKAWLAGNVNKISKNLSLRTLYRAQLALREDFGAPPFEGLRNVPEDNKGIVGKYVLVGSTEAFDAFAFDPDTNLLKSINLDLLFDDFNGLLFGKVIYKFDPYPMRFDAQGNFVAPQIYDDTTKKCLPNPSYTNLDTAPYEIAFLLGDSACRTVKVGAPPKEFASQSISAKKFYSLRWNGEVQITDQVLVQYPDGSVDLNVYGTQLKLISQVVHGFLPVEPRFCLPILFKRARPQENT